MTYEELMAVPLRERIRHVRKDISEMTQAAFAAEVGVSERTVKGWESVDGKRGAPDEVSAARLSELSGYPAWAFMTPPPFEEAIAEEISRKLDLLIAHLGPERRPIPAAESEAALLRLEQNAAGGGLPDPDAQRSAEGDR